MNKEKIYNKRSLLRLRMLLMGSFFIFLSTALFSQQYVRPAPEGIYIILGKEFPKDFEYRISRKSERESAFNIIAQVKAPENKLKYEEQINATKDNFIYLSAINPTTADRYWDYFSTHENIDSLVTIEPALTYLALGIGYLDTAAMPGLTYEYQVQKIKSGAPIETNNFPQFKYDIPIISADVTFHTANYDNITSILKWLIKQKMNLQKLVVFRRDNLKGEFLLHPITVRYTRREDTTFAIVQDTLIKPFEIYEYQLAPVDLFGNLGERIKTVQHATFSDYDFPYLRQFDAVSEDNRQVKVTWNFDQKDFIRSIKLMRSMNFDSGFVQIAELPPTDTMYIDYASVAMENYYYRLMLNGPLNISKQTVATRGRYLETGIPDPPVNVKGIGLDHGVQIEWDDVDRISLGFYVYRQNIGNGQMEQISEFIRIDTSRHFVYQDTSAALRGDIIYQYAVQTVNDGFQTSALSDTISIRPNIATTITPPSALRLKKEGKNCYLFWNDQAKVNANLDTYILYRKRSDEADFSIFTEIPSTRNHYLDTTIVMGYSYDYQLQSKDIFGSVSSITFPKSAEWYYLAPAPPGKPRVSKTQRGVVVRWNEVRQDGIKEYKIYRYKPGMDPEVINTSSSEILSYLDEKAEAGSLYFYYITSINDQDIESQPGKSVSIRI